MRSSTVEHDLLGLLDARADGRAEVQLHEAGVHRGKKSVPTTKTRPSDASDDAARTMTTVKRAVVRARCSSSAAVDVLEALEASVARAR